MAQANRSDSPAATPSRDLPRYRVTEKCYLRPANSDIERVIDPEEMPPKRDEYGQLTGDLEPLVIAYEGIPAYFLEPVNAAAKAMCEKHAARMQRVNPLNDMTKVS